MAKQSRKTTTANSADKLHLLSNRELADVCKKISQKNSTLHADGPVAPSTWAINESHDTDALLFEELCYHMFAAGFSRKVVRDKWPAHQQAFFQFDPIKVATMPLETIEKLVLEKELIRNRRKLTAVIKNARKLVEISAEHGSFSQWLNSYATPNIYLLHREIADIFAGVGRSAAEWFLLSSGFPYYFATDDARRVLKRLGLLPKGRKDESFDASMQALQTASGMASWEISIDLWRFGSGFRMREAVCGDAAPNCAKCPLWDYCDFFNQDLNQQ